MYRERITITVDKELLQAVDSLIDKEVLRNRSQTIEHLVREGIGLHQLTQVVLFLGPDFDQICLEKIINLCDEAQITQFFICLPSTSHSLISQIQNTIEKIIPVARVTPIPGDFGSGGALILQKDKLTTPFLLAWPDTTIEFPANLVNPYVFHRQHHQTLTHLLNGSNPSGLTLANPDLMNHIPAGLVDLQSSVFPGLEKTGKVRGYIY